MVRKRPFLKNCAVIALLLGMIGLTWSAYQKKSAAAVRQQAELDAESAMRLVKEHAQPPAPITSSRDLMAAVSERVP